MANAKYCIIVIVLQISHSLEFRHISAESRVTNSDDSNNYVGVLHGSAHKISTTDKADQGDEGDNIRPRSVQNLGSSSRDTSPIMFPDFVSTSQINPLSATPRRDDQAHFRRRTNRVPLNVLRKLANEPDISKVFEKYVSNVKLQEVNGQKYLVNSEGVPINTALGGPVIIESEPSKPITKIKAPVSGFSLAFRNTSRPSSISSERVGNSPKIVKPAICEPELKTVEVPSSNDPNIIQFPKCVRLERCGGCCGSDLLTCEPLRSKPTEVQVQKFAYNEETEQLEYQETEIIRLPSHTECRCNCRVKSADCSSRHVYNSEDCLCTCKNRGEQDNCLRQPHKLWDSNLCQCICREIKACSSGYLFNPETCECALSSEFNKSQSTLTINSQRHRREPNGHRRIQRTISRK